MYLVGQLSEFQFQAKRGRRDFMMILLRNDGMSPDYIRNLEMCFCLVVSISSAICICIRSESAQQCENYLNLGKLQPPS